MCSLVMCLTGGGGGGFCFVSCSLCTVGARELPWYRCKAKVTLHLIHPTVLIAVRHVTSQSTVMPTVVKGCCHASPPSPLPPQIHEDVRHMCLWIYHVLSISNTTIPKSSMGKLLRIAYKYKFNNNQYCNKIIITVLF